MLLSLQPDRTFIYVSTLNLRALVIHLPTLSHSFSTANSEGNAKCYVQEIDDQGTVIFKDTMGPDGLIEGKWYMGDRNDRTVAEQHRPNPHFVRGGDARGRPSKVTGRPKSLGWRKECR
jgi:hypothetical protein